MEKRYIKKEGRHYIIYHEFIFHGTAYRTKTEYDSYTRAKYVMDYLLD